VLSFEANGTMHLGELRSEGRDVTLRFSSGDYHFKQIQSEGLGYFKVQSEGEVRLFIEGDLMLTHLASCRQRYGVSLGDGASGGELMFYVGGSVLVKSYNPYYINALIYAHEHLSLKGGVQSEIHGALHGKERLSIGTLNPVGRWVMAKSAYHYDSERLGNLRSDYFKKGSCRRLPKDPASKGLEGIDGVDANRNGLRDDMERYIDETFQGKPKLILAYRDNLRAKQVLMKATTREEVITHLRPSLDAGDCIRSLVANYRKNKALRDAFNDALLNTKERYKAFWNYHSLLSGSSFGPDSPEPCAFKLDAVGDACGIKCHVCVQCAFLL